MLYQVCMYTIINCTSIYILSDLVTDNENFIYKFSQIYIVGTLGCMFGVPLILQEISQFKHRVPRYVSILR